MFSYFIAFFGSLADRNQKILNSFVVNLKHGNIDFVLFIRIIVLVNSFENFLAGDGHNSLHEAVATLLAP